MLGVLLLGACRKTEQAGGASSISTAAVSPALTSEKLTAKELETQLLFVAAGTYDAQAEHKSREGGSLRKVAWRAKPPFTATQISVLYDGNQRAQVWKMTFEDSTIDWPLSRMKAQQSTRGEVWRWPDGEPTLAGAALWQEAGAWILETRAYLVHYDANFLRELDGD